MKAFTGLRNMCMVATVAVLWPSSLLLAAGASPGGGELLQQIQSETPETPSRDEVDLKLPERKEGEIPEGISFRVEQILIEGNTVIDTATLHQLVADSEGRDMSLRQLNELVDHITEYYHRHGYSLSRAVLPAQEVEEGTVTIRVIEARYNEIRLDNRSLVRDGLLDATLSPLHSGDPVHDEELNRSILLLSDIPGVEVEAVLKPGDEVGESDLNVKVKDRSRMAGRFLINSYGNRYTGRVRSGLSLNLNNPFRLGDRLSFDGTTTGQRIRFGRFGYEAVANGNGTKLGAYGSFLDYALGGPFSSLDADGTAQTMGAWLSYPLRRGLDLNLFVRAGYEHKRLHDRVYSGAVRTDRNLENAYLGIEGNVRDGFLSGAVSSWSFRLTNGRVRFDDANAKVVDAVTARTAGSFRKVMATATRWQQLRGSASLHLSLSGQWAASNLDSVEKLVVGGPDGVRGYDVGVLSADAGYLFRSELRYDVTRQIQLFALLDHQRIHLNRRSWQAGQNGATLNGAGGGFRMRFGRWHAEASVAGPVGSRPALVSDASSLRFWASAGMNF